MIAKKPVIYVKEFTSETHCNDTSFHGSPNIRSSQGISKEDKELRKAIISKYSFNVKNYSKCNEEHEGFDGREQYTFRIFSEFPEGTQDNPGTNVKYKTLFSITKCGSPQDVRLNRVSDLEEELLSNKFEKVKLED